jgi:hypothetical protein
MEKAKKHTPPQSNESQEVVNWKVVGPLVALLAAAVLYVTFLL